MNNVYLLSVTIQSKVRQSVQFKMEDIYAPFATKTLMTSLIPEHILNVTDTDLDGLLSDEIAWVEFNNGEYLIEYLL